MSASQETNYDVPAAIADLTVVDEIQINLEMKITGKEGTRYAGESLELGLSLSKNDPQNRVHIKTTRGDTVPTTFMSQVRNDLARLLAGVVFGALNGNGMPTAVLTHTIATAPTNPGTIT